MEVFEPGNIGKLTLKNRVVMVAIGMGGLIQADDRFSHRAIDYYVLASSNPRVRTLVHSHPCPLSFGDCKGPREVINVICEGFRLARLV